MYTFLLIRLITVSSLCILLLTSLNTKAQSAGSVDIGLQVEQNYFLKSHHKGTTLGVLSNLWISKKIALNYSFSLGQDQNGALLIKTGLGQALSVLLSTPAYRNRGLAFLSLILPEGITVKMIPDNRNVNVFAYFNPLRIDNLSTPISLQQELGVRAALNLGDNILVGPSLGVRFPKGKQYWALHGGINIFFSFSSD